MKRLVMLALAVFGVARASKAELITVPFSAVVDEFLGAPFGIQAEVGVTPLTGWFRYDTSTPPAGPPCTNCEGFLAKPPSAFSLSIGGITITSSDFILRTHNSISGGPDIFRADSDSDGFNSTGGEFLVNGAQTDGAAVIQLIDNDLAMFATDAAAHVLPTATQLLHVDFVTGHLADEHAPGGESVNVIRFRGTVPEPATAVGIVTSIAALLLGTRRRRQRV